MNATDPGFEERIAAEYLIDRKSIRQLADQEHMSYRAMRTRLLEAGVTLRGRGGDTRAARRMAARQQPVSEVTE